MANEIFVDTDGDSDIDLGLYDFEKDDDGSPAPLADITDETGDGFADVNLTQANSLAVINGAIFTDAVNVGSGTGGYNTFLALADQTGGESPQDYYSQGFNSNDTNPLDSTNDEIDHSKTATVLLGAIPIQYINGVAYYEFRVDLNESNDSIDTQISLDQFRLYTSTNGDIQSTNDLFDTTTGDGDAAVTTLRYDMDAGHNISVLLSEANSSGSGNDDYAVLVPVANFAGLDPASTYLYLWVQMGAADGAAGSSTSPWHEQGGFEEWNIQNALIVRGTKYADLDGDGVQDPGEVGQAGVTIYIDNDLDGVVEATDGNGVIDAGEQTTVTDANGNWSFGGIPIFDNNYTIKIREVVPTGYFPTTQTSDQFGPYVQVTISSQADAGTIITAPSLFNQPLIDLSGTKYTDTDGDGVIDAGESGLGGVIVFIDNDGDGELRRRHRYCHHHRRQRHLGVHRPGQQCDRQDDLRSPSRRLCPDPGRGGL
jgi:hypothetical protein